MNTIFLLTGITIFSCCSESLQCMACELRCHSRVGEIFHWQGRFFFSCIFIIQHKIIKGDKFQWHFFSKVCCRDFIIEGILHRNFYLYHIQISFSLRNVLYFCFVFNTCRSTEKMFPHKSGLRFVKRSVFGIWCVLYWSLLYLICSYVSYE